MLFLLEKPGPMTDSSRSGVRKGSGFISRNNDDPTAEATWHFMSEAGIPRRKTLIWNVIPWWNGTIDIKRDEHEQGLQATARLIELLPKLRGVVLVGKKAGRAQPFLAGKGLYIATSPHPSPQVRAAFPTMWRGIGTTWHEAARHLGCLSD
ncbi:uracil-DNA glycosylase [Belnapia sp. T18]|uniref:Uracil-DNA glycosylase n=1 Tax=Belnapia arida TaxID=2804533 RepID=A0ABS1U3F4_9PROT|nr:uracil-DNA glycosylase [Belnapia arida]MBL6079199.1 uracil-DNA glycosylase [Belnapia arida]